MATIKIKDGQGVWHKITAIRGVEGKSAYDLAVEGGYQGTEEDFIADLLAVEGLVDELAGI